MLAYTQRNPSLCTNSTFIANFGDLLQSGLGLLEIELVRCSGTAPLFAAIPQCFRLIVTDLLVYLCALAGSSVKFPGQHLPPINAGAESTFAHLFLDPTLLFL